MSRAVGQDRNRHGLNPSAKSRTLEYHYEQGNFDLPAFEIAMGDGNLEAAQQEMADNASPALTRFADQSRLEERIEELSTEMANSDIALQDAITRNDRDGTNIAKARIKPHTEKQAYEEGRRAVEDALTVHEVYSRKRELHDIGRYMRMVREHFSETAIARLESHRDDQLYDLREQNPRSASGPNVINIHDKNRASDPTEFCLSMKLLTKFLTQQCLRKPGAPVEDEEDDAAGDRYQAYLDECMEITPSLAAYSGFVKDVEAQGASGDRISVVYGPMVLDSDNSGIVQDHYAGFVRDLY
jgi:hypothetical protein